MKNPNDFLAMYANQYNEQFETALNALGYASVKQEFAKEVIELGKYLDQTNQQVRDLMRFAYLLYWSNPCDNKAYDNLWECLKQLMKMGEHLRIITDILRTIREFPEVYDSFRRIEAPTEQSHILAEVVKTPKSDFDKSLREGLYEQMKSLQRDLETIKELLEPQQSNQ